MIRWITKKAKLRLQDIAGQRMSCKCQRLSTSKKIITTGRIKAIHNYGAVLVETAFSLILMMALLAVFWETIQVMLAHQRTTYAAYIAERSRVVGVMRCWRARWWAAAV